MTPLQLSIITGAAILGLLASLFIMLGLVSSKNDSAWMARMQGNEQNTSPKRTFYSMVFSEPAETMMEKFGENADNYRKDCAASRNGASVTERKFVMRLLGVFHDIQLEVAEDNPVRTSHRLCVLHADGEHVVRHLHFQEVGIEAGIEVLAGCFHRVRIRYTVRLPVT